MNRRAFLGATALSASRVFGANDRVRVALIGDGVRVAGAEYVVFAASDFRRALDYPHVDAVQVAGPGQAKVMIAACEAGKDIYLETLGASIAESAAMLAAAQRHPGLVIQAGMPHRSSPHLQEAKRIIQSGDLGDVRFVRAGDGIHHIDMVQYILGEPLPVSVSAVGSRYGRQATVEYTNMVASYDDAPGIAVYGTQGTLVRHLIATNEPHVANFIDCVRSRATPNSPIASAYRSHSVAHLADISYAAGHRLKVSVAGAA